MWRSAVAAAELIILRGPGRPTVLAEPCASRTRWIKSVSPCTVCKACSAGLRSPLHFRLPLAGHEILYTLRSLQDRSSSMVPVWPYPKLVGSGPEGCVLLNEPVDSTPSVPTCVRVRLCCMCLCVVDSGCRCRLSAVDFANSIIAQFVLYSYLYLVGFGFTLSLAPGRLRRRRPGRRLLPCSPLSLSLSLSDG